MKYSPQQIGHLLAIALSGDTASRASHGDGMSESEKDLLRKLQSQIEKNKKVNRSGEKRLLPEYRCQTEDGVLQREPQIFVDIMTMLDREIDDESRCASFILHLNNCFQCYETFVSVVREYFHETRKLNDSV